MFEYISISSKRIAVKQDHQLLGHIKIYPPHRNGTTHGFQFVPAGRMRSDRPIYNSLEVCKMTIEHPAPDFVDALKAHQARR